MIPDDLNTLNFPISTELQQKFWGSRHKCNQMKSIIAFSFDIANANDNLRRYGYTRAWREKAINAFGKYVNTPSFAGVPFSTTDEAWWDCMPYAEPECEGIWVPQFTNRTAQWIETNSQYNIDTDCRIEFDTIFPSGMDTETFSYFATEDTNFLMNEGKAFSYSYYISINNEQYISGATTVPKHRDKIVRVRLTPTLTKTSKLYWGGDPNLNYKSPTTFISNMSYECNKSPFQDRVWPNITQADSPTVPTNFNFPEQSGEISKGTTFKQIPQWTLYKKC